MERVTGGTWDEGFEKAWAEYVSANCGDCIFVVEGKTTFCQSEKLNASRAYAAGKPIKCAARILPA